MKTRKSPHSKKKVSGFKKRRHAVGNKSAFPYFDIKEENILEFEAESVLLHHTQVPANYQNDPYLKKLSHTSVFEIAIHFGCVGLPWPIILFKEGYNAAILIPSTHPGGRNKMNNDTRLLQEEIGYRRRLLHSGYKKMMQPEQKSVNFLQDIICSLPNRRIWFRMLTVERLLLVERVCCCHSIIAM